MATAWDKIEQAYKKLQPQIKQLDVAKTEKQIKLTKAALEKAWDAEEVFIEALEGAKKSGLKGKKPADYLPDPKFKKTHAALTKEATTHATTVKALQTMCDKAKPLDKLLVKMLADIKKEIKKGDKAQAKFQKEVMDVQAKSKLVAHAVGKLTAPELLYGPSITRVVDKIINKSKGAKGPSGDAEKLIEEKELGKNLKSALNLMKSAEKLCKGALKKARTDPAAADPFIEKAEELIDELEGINKAYVKVTKKNAKLIKESKDKSKIERAIKGISKAHDAAGKTYAAVKKALKKQAA